MFYDYENATCAELTKNIKMLMVKSKLGKRKFAAEIGISYETLMRFLKGEKIYLTSFSKIVDYCEKNLK